MTLEVNLTKERIDRNSIISNNISVNAGRAPGRLRFRTEKEFNNKYREKSRPIAMSGSVISA